VAYVRIEADNMRSLIRFVDIDSGETVPFEIEVPYRQRAGDVYFGRSRWLPDGSALAYVGLDEEGLSGIYAQDFRPGEDTRATRRKLAGFSRDFITESFGISPDGRRMSISTLEGSYSLALAEEVPGIARPEDSG
jgi:hypothetical protein